jgi:endothelin-converting enzyme/putative endopeptidase
MLLTAYGVCAEEEAGVTESPLTALPYTPSLDPQSIDRSIDPCEDLYTFACGNWQKRNPIPPDQSSWSVYSKLYVDNQRYLWGILEDAAKGGPARSPTQRKIGDYFAACMDEKAIDRAGLAPLQGDLASIDALTDKESLGKLLGSLHLRAANRSAFFGSGSQQDARDSTQVIVGIEAAGLGLPDREYYVKDDEKSVETRARYVDHIGKMLMLAGEPEVVARAHATAVMRIETALAKASLTRVERRDPYKTYHRETLESLHRMAPDFDWRGYFAATGQSPAPWLNVEQPAFVGELDARIREESLGDLKTYLRWALLESTAPYLSQPLVAERFAFNLAYLRGLESDRPRWKKCVSLVDQQLGEALGKEFVTHAFPASNKAKTVTMTEQIEAAMRKRIQALDWMTPETKTQALAKLAAMRNKVGYPDVWRDYSALSIAPADFFGNVMRGFEFEARRDAAKIGKPVDRNEWGMTAPTVNAYYDPPMNDINFPAGVLMPPLFDPKMDDAPNYGDTGGTIGHELTHGFDDAGRQYDGAGNLRDWWRKSDAETFEQRAQCIRDQYSQYTIIDDIKINGALTSGEDIADLGGELLAWMAWQEQTRLMQLESRDGLTPEQRFFVGYAQWACANERPEDLRADAVTNEHSPARYRINGVVTNMPQFARAFDCKAGAALVKKPAQMCRVW